MTLKLNLSVFVKLTLLHANNLSYFHNTCRRLMIWWCGWRKPFVTTKLLRSNLLAKILFTFQFYQASQHWLIGRWRHMVIELLCSTLLHMTLVLLLFFSSHKGMMMKCWEWFNMLRSWKRSCNWNMVKCLHQLCYFFTNEWKMGMTCNPTYKQDDVGFLHVNFWHLLHEFDKPFVFPSHV